MFHAIWKSKRKRAEIGHYLRSLQEAVAAAKAGSPQAERIASEAQREFDALRADPAGHRRAG